MSYLSNFYQKTKLFSAKKSKITHSMLSKTTQYYLIVKQLLTKKEP